MLAISHSLTQPLTLSLVFACVCVRVFVCDLVWLCGCVSVHVHVGVFFASMRRNYLIVLVMFPLIHKSCRYQQPQGKGSVGDPSSQHALCQLRSLRCPLLFFDSLCFARLDTGSLYDGQDIQLTSILA